MVALRAARHEKAAAAGRGEHRLGDKGHGETGDTGVEGRAAIVENFRRGPGGQLMAGSDDAITLSHGFPSPQGEGGERSEPGGDSFARAAKIASTTPSNSRSIWLFQNLKISVTRFLQNQISVGVSREISVKTVLTAVNFDDQPPSTALEVHNVGWKWATDGENEIQAHAIGEVLSKASLPAASFSCEVIEPLRWPS